MLKKLQLFIFFSVFFGVALSFAGTTGKIAGRVFDKETGEALPGANIRIDKTQRGAASNMTGEYFLINLPPGTYSLVVTYLGYKRVRINDIAVTIDKTTRVDVPMTTEALAGEEVVVTAYKPNTVEKELTSTKQTYRMEDVEQLAGIDDIADILELQADVVDNHFRGGRTNETNYLVGGNSINNPLSNGRSFEPMVAALEEVEVITSGFSAEYGNAQSGIVNMVMKEGGDQWKTRFDVSMDLPHYQQWGGNPYSQENMQFYRLLSNPREWILPVESDEGEILYPYQRGFESYIPDNRFAYFHIRDREIREQRMIEDSLRNGRMAMLNWMQMVRDVGLEYNDMPRHRIDITAGGPITDNIRLFFAASQRKKELYIPTPHPDLLRQLMGNLTGQISQNDKLTLSYTFNYNYSSDVGRQKMFFDRILNVGKEIETSGQYALKWNHIFSPSTYMDISLKYMDTQNKRNPEFLDPGRFRDIDAHNGSRYTENGYVGQYKESPTVHTMNSLYLNRRDEKTKSYGLDISMVSQINHNNLFKAGIQLQGYDLDVFQENNLKSPAERAVVDFAVQPYEGAIYIQDKMEVQGLIGNFGLRYDFFNYNYEYFSNQFSPLLNPHFPEKGQIYDPEYAEKEKTKLFGRLQPRLGVSFPISEKSVFHLNYGTFIQRAGFNDILYTRYNALGLLEEIGNPRLLPERTSSYDIGIVQALPWNIRLDVSAFYKDVQDLTEEAIFVNAGNENYRNKANRDYADIKGFNVNVERSTGLFSTYLRYNYQTAKGKASEAGDALIVLYEKPLPDGTVIDLPDPRDIFLDYDRTHRVIANLRLNTPSGFGPNLFAIKPLEGFSVSTTLTYQTGMPYTYDELLLGLVNNKRQPSFTDLRLRVQKMFNLGRFRYILYLEGFNILNKKEWDDDVFETDSDLLRRWVNGHREELLYFDGAYEEGDGFDQQYLYTRPDLIYRNQPRYFRLGIRADF
jgi:outer membrane receptor protein involved in Fe transport